MAAIDPPSSVDGLAATRVFRNSARFYAPPQIMQLFADVVLADQLALVVDIDALERSIFARVDRVMLCALDALSYAKVQVVLVSRLERDRAAMLHRGIPTSWMLDDDLPLITLRQRMPGVRMVGVSDDPDLLGSLASHDRGIALGGKSELARANIVASGDVSVRAALWWLVDTRSRATEPLPP